MDQSEEEQLKAAIAASLEGASGQDEDVIDVDDDSIEAEEEQKQAQLEPCPDEPPGT